MKNEGEWMAKHPMYRSQMSNEGEWTVVEYGRSFEAIRVKPEGEGCLIGVWEKGQDVPRQIADAHNAAIAAAINAEADNWRKAMSAASDLAKDTFDDERKKLQKMTKANLDWFDEVQQLREQLAAKQKELEETTDTLHQQIKNDNKQLASKRNEKRTTGKATEKSMAANKIRGMHEQMQQNLDDARKTPEYTQEGLQQQLDAEREKPESSEELIEQMLRAEIDIIKHEHQQQLAAEQKKLEALEFQNEASIIKGLKEQLAEMTKDRDRWRDLAHGGPTKRPAWRSE